jgi:signal transduction histidine kinase/phage shock protein PspC (stress-responsive transcriptional regulator)
VSDTAPTGGSDTGREPLVRRADGRLIAGVCTGIARHLRVHVVIVRLIFLVVGSNGIGVVAYLVLWAMVPDESDDGSGRSKLRRPKQVIRAVVRNRPGDIPHRRRWLVTYVVAGTILGAIFDTIGFGLGRGGLPLSVALLGALLIWWRAPERQRKQWSQDARIAGTFLGRRAPLLIMLGGVGLVILGITSFLAAHDALAQARAGALAIAATLVGVLLVTGPFLYRLIGQVTEERRRRIRADERAAVATHVHDSVLQTLALIQAKAQSPDDVRRLARRQERELREWLYSPDSPSTDSDMSFAVALRATAIEIEDESGLPIEVVVVGDAPLDDPLRATVAAAREAMLNAARSSGAPQVQVFAEVEPASVEVFVRDRGRGFDVTSVSSDRRGIRDSIVGRMARHGGTGVIRSGPDGTEVALMLSRATS